MPNKQPIPGRIDPIQTTLQTLPKPAKSAVDVGAGVAIGNVAGVGVVVAGKYLNNRAKNINSKRMADFRNNINNGSTDSIPKAKGRISNLEQGIFITFAALVDTVEAILDCFAIGVIANRIIDIIVAIIFFLYALFKGLSIAENYKVYGSILGTIIGEFIPVLDVAPFFVLDAWYITHTLKKQKQAAQEQINAEADEIVQEKKKQLWMENYERNQAQEQEQYE